MNTNKWAIRRDGKYLTADRRWVTRVDKAKQYTIRIWADRMARKYGGVVVGVAAGREG